MSQQPGGSPRADDDGDRSGQEAPHCQFVTHVLLAEFDLRAGAVLRHCLPCPIAGYDDDALAHRLIPEASHARAADTILFYLQADANRQRPARSGVGEGGVRHGLAVMIARRTADSKRGVTVKSLGVVSPSPAVYCLRPLLEQSLSACLRLEGHSTAEAAAQHDARMIRRTWAALRAIDLKSVPRLGRWHRQAIRGGMPMPGLSLGSLQTSDALARWRRLAAARLHEPFTVHMPLLRWHAPGDGHDEEGDDESGGESAPLQVRVSLLDEPASVPHAAASLSAVLRAWGRQAMTLFNAVLAGKRVLVVGPTASVAELASLVLGIAAMVGPPLGGVLRRCFPYVSLADLDGDRPFTAHPDGYIAGTTNPIFDSMEDHWDVLADVDKHTVRMAPRMFLDCSRAAAGTASFWPEHWPLRSYPHDAQPATAVPEVPAAAVEASAIDPPAQLPLPPVGAGQLLAWLGSQVEVRPSGGGRRQRLTEESSPLLTGPSQPVVPTADRRPGASAKPQSQLSVVATGDLATASALGRVQQPSSMPAGLANPLAAAAAAAAAGPAFHRTYDGPSLMQLGSSFPGASRGFQMLDSSQLSRLIGGLPHGDMWLRNAFESYTRALVRVGRRLEGFVSKWVRRANSGAGATGQLPALDQQTAMLVAMNASRLLPLMRTSVWRDVAAGAATAHPGSSRRGADGEPAAAAHGAAARDAAEAARAGTLEAARAGTPEAARAGTPEAERAGSPLGRDDEGEEEAAGGGLALAEQAETLPAEWRRQVTLSVKSLRQRTSPRGARSLTSALHLLRQLMVQADAGQWEDRVAFLLAQLPETSGGLQPLGACLMSSDPAVSAPAAAVLRVVERCPDPRLSSALQRLNYMFLARLARMDSE